MKIMYGLSLSPTGLEHLCPAWLAGNHTHLKKYLIAKAKQSLQGTIYAQSRPTGYNRNKLFVL